jgi:hypothetical protein
MVYYLPGTSHGTGHGFRFYDDRTTPPRWDSYDVLIANKMTYLRDDGSRPRHVLCWEPAGEDYFDFFYLGHDCWPITMYTCMFCRRGPSDLEAQDGRPPCPPPGPALPITAATHSRPPHAAISAWSFEHSTSSLLHSALGKYCHRQAHAVR